MNQNNIYYSYSTDYNTIRPLNTLIKQIPASFANRAKRYKFEQDAYNFVLGRLLLQKAIVDSKVPLSLEDLYYNKAEKPLLDGLYFSIAHSQNLVACAFSTTGEIGLDIEFPRDINRKHFRHCFNSQEWQLIETDKSLNTFYSFWTKKEAILKANGVGLNRLMDMEILDNESALFKNTNSTKKMHLKDLSFEGLDAHACLCSNLKLEAISIQKIEF